MKIFRVSDFVLAGSWLLAFILSLPLIEPQALSRLGAVAAMCVFGAVGIGRDLCGPGLQASRSVLPWFLYALCLLALASVAWSAAPMVTLVAFATLCLLPAGFVVFSSARGLVRMLIPFAPALFAVLCGLALWAMAQRFVFTDMLVNGGVRHPFANPNSFASLLMLGFFPALGWATAAVGKRPRLIATVAAALLLAGIVTIGGRAVLVLTVLGFVAYLAACRGMVFRRPVVPGAIAFAGVAALLLQYAMPYTGARQTAPVATRIVRMMADEDASWATRVEIWKATAAMIRDHALSGTGYGTFFLFYPEYRRAGDAYSAGFMAHNDMLQLWAELGPSAPLLLLLFYACAASRMIAMLRRCGPASGERAIAFSLFTGAALVALNAMVNFDLYTAPILCLLGAVLGLWHRYTALALADPAAAVRLPARAPAIAGWCLASLPFLALFLCAQGMLRSEHQADQAQKAAFAQDWNAFDRHVNASIRLSGGWNARPYVLAAGVPVAIVQQKNLLSPMARTQAMNQADFLLERAERADPRLVSIYYDRALMARAGGSGDEKDSRAWLTQALRLNPGHIPSRMLLADSYYAGGRKAEALKILEAGLDRPVIAHDPENFYAMTASIALEQGDMKANARALERMDAWRRERQWRRGLVPPGEDQAQNLH